MNVKKLTLNYIKKTTLCVVMFVMYKTPDLLSPLRFSAIRDATRRFTHIHIARGSNTHIDKAAFGNTHSGGYMPGYVYSSIYIVMYMCMGV